MQGPFTRFTRLVLRVTEDEHGGNAHGRYLETVISGTRPAAIRTRPPDTASARPGPCRRPRHLIAPPHLLPPRASSCCSSAYPPPHPAGRHSSATVSHALEGWGGSGYVIDFAGLAWGQPRLGRCAAGHPVTSAACTRLLTRHVRQRRSCLTSRTTTARRSMFLAQSRHWTRSFQYLCACPALGMPPRFT
jgi:hypothetical protein